VWVNLSKFDLHAGNMELEVLPPPPICNHQVVLLPTSCKGQGHPATGWGGPRSSG